MRDEGKPQNLRKGFLGQIVLGGTESPGDQNQIGPGSGQTERLLQPFPVVSDGGMVIHVDSQLGAFAGEIGGMGIHNLTQKQLRSNRNDFAAHTTLLFFRSDDEKGGAPPPGGGLALTGVWKSG